jgi:hypothetical protein
MINVDFAKYLEQTGFGVYAEDGTATIFDRLPDTPDVAIAVSLRPGRTSSIWNSIEDSSVQILVRGVPEDSSVVAQKAQDIYNALHGQMHITLAVDGPRYLSIVCPQGGPVDAGRDENERAVYSLQFNARWRNSARST